MDENQHTTEEITKTTNIEHKICDCPTHPFWKWLCIGILIFLGAFCASYVLLDWHTKAIMLRPRENDFYRIMQNDMNIANKMMKAEKTFAQNGSNLIHMEQTKDNYKIKIDLKPFDNNEENVQVSTNEHILTISGRSVQKTKNNERITRFQQSYMFGDDVKLDNMTKEVNKNYLIINIPIEKNNDD